jgi:hypothetical protein
MRTLPFAFLKVGSRWINFALVTDVEDEGDSLTVFFASDMARMVGGVERTPLDVARRIKITDPDEVKMVRQWLRISDEN